MFTGCFVTLCNKNFFLKYYFSFPVVLDGKFCNLNNRSSCFGVPCRNSVNKWRNLGAVLWTSLGPYIIQLYGWWPPAGQLLWVLWRASTTHLRVFRYGSCLSSPLHAAIPLNPSAATLWRLDTFLLLFRSRNVIVLTVQKTKDWRELVSLISAMLILSRWGNFF